ncbi:uncharacterized protein [Parasteatoda tepidariorum]|uniref:uncharacterized protein isoform X3 n=1 Tax=Parasteatoda tepidariorum TaxID=114398 RepID=UPI00077FA602|nr:uncharacterized protein LOC107456753 isoform X2 [Parasteatoda tepidariorum]
MHTSKLILSSWCILFITVFLNNNFVECKNYPFKVYGIYGDHHGKRHHHGRHAYTPPPKKVTTHKPAVKHRGLLGGLFGGIGGLANGIVRGVKNVVGEVLPPLRPITDTVLG